MCQCVKTDILSITSIILLRYGPRVFATMQLYENLKIQFLNRLVDF